MNKITIETTTDDTGTFRVQVPDRPGRYHVRVTVEWEQAGAPDEWPPGWLDEAFGSIADPTFVRPPQPPYEKRKQLK